MSKPLLTSGQFAKRAGVTIRTIRYYDKVGLLNPSSYNQAGYRMYNERDFEKLQKILTLKFIGFPLEDIQHIMTSEMNETDMIESLHIQKQIIEEKISHLQLVQEAIREAGERLEGEESIDWNQFIHIIQVMKSEQLSINQYQNASNLQARITLHDQFSTNRIGWHSWLFEQLPIQPGSRILELGCGDASLWKKNSDRIPCDCEIILSDSSSGMIQDAINNLGHQSKHFTYKVLDAQEIPFGDLSFDLIIASHLLYHVPNRDKAFSEIRRVLKGEGWFYSSTIGSNNLREMENLITEFDSTLILSEVDITEKFGLENGKQQLRPWFEEVEVLGYDDALHITKSKPLVAYIRSTPGNAKEKLVGATLKAFKYYVYQMIKAQGYIHITKETGLFIAQKIEGRGIMNNRNLQERIRVVIGAGEQAKNNPGWIHTQEDQLNLLKREDWEKLFAPQSITTILAEHVWEHLSFDEGIQAAKNCFDFLTPGGFVRCAVPDGFFPDEDYQNMVQVGGPGPADHPAASHKIVYTYKSITEVFEAAGCAVIRIL